MGWQTPQIAKLKNGETVKFRPCGVSTKDKLNFGKCVKIEDQRSFYASYYHRRDCQKWSNPIVRGCKVARIGKSLCCCADFGKKNGKIMSPRLVNKSDAARFVKTIEEDTNDEV